MRAFDTEADYTLLDRLRTGRSNPELAQAGLDGLPSRAVIVSDLPKSAVKPFSDIVGSYLTTRIGSFKPGSFRETASKDYQNVGFAFSIPLSQSNGPTGDAAVEVKISIGTRVFVDSWTTEGADGRAQRAVGQLVDDLELIANTFMARAKRHSIHFVFPDEHGAEEGLPPASDRVRRETLKRIFAGNSTNLFLVLFIFSLLLLFVFGTCAIFAVLAVQLTSLFFADKLALSAGEVRPTSESPSVTVVSFPITPETVAFLTTAGRQHLDKIKNDLGAVVKREHASEPASKEAVREVLSADRIEASADEIRIVKKDVFGLVRQTAEKFGLPAPKITILNAFMDNAAATGISPSRSSIAITAGALEDLDDEELQSVVGHEFGHVKGRDPVILFSTTALVIIGGFFWTPLVEFLGFSYFLLAFAVIYAVGKVLETRADTASASVLGEAQVLAKALTSIGYPLLYREKHSSAARLFGWLVFDSHPPTYFRVNRLNRLAETGKKVSHALAVSLRDSAEGFLKALVGRE